MNPLDRLLHFFALREGRRVDGFNLAADPALSLLPHRIFAGLLAAAILLASLGMAGRWQLMKSQNPPSSAQLAELNMHLQETAAATEALRISFNPEEAKQLGIQVREANFLIALRALRPSEQLADLEAVKPFTVRFSGLQRKLDRAGTVEFDFRLIAADRTGFTALRDRIARSHRFTELQLRSEMITPNGYEAMLSVVWAPVGAPERTELPPALPKAAPAPAMGLQPAGKPGLTAQPPRSALTGSPGSTPSTNLRAPHASPLPAPQPAVSPARPAPLFFPSSSVHGPRPPNEHPPEQRSPQARPGDPRPSPPPTPLGDGGDR